MKDLTALEKDKEQLQKPNIPNESFNKTNLIQETSKHNLKKSNFPKPNNEEIDKFNFLAKSRRIKSKSLSSLDWQTSGYERKTLNVLNENDDQPLVFNNTEKLPIERNKFPSSQLQTSNCHLDKVNSCNVNDEKVDESDFIRTSNSKMDSNSLKRDNWQTESSETQQELPKKKCKLSTLESQMSDHNLNISLNFKDKFETTEEIAPLFQESVLDLSKPSTSNGISRRSSKLHKIVEKTDRIIADNSNTLINSLNTFKRPRKSEHVFAMPRNLAPKKKRKDDKSPVNTRLLFEDEVMRPERPQTPYTEKQAAKALEFSFKMLSALGYSHKKNLPEDIRECQKLQHLSNTLLEQEQMHMSERSQVIQRKLPRPKFINENILIPDDETFEELLMIDGLSEEYFEEVLMVEEMIRKEMLTVMYYDSIENPLCYDDWKITSKCVAQAESYLQKYPFEHFETQEMEKARDLITEEMANMKKKLDFESIDIKMYTEIWEECWSEIVYSHIDKQYKRASSASHIEKILAAKNKLKQNKALMLEEVKRAAKLEKILQYTLSIEKNEGILRERIKNLQNEMEYSYFELLSIKIMEAQEKQEFEQRSCALTADVEKQKERERSLKSKYDKLLKLLEQYEN